MEHELDQPSQEPVEPAKELERLELKLISPEEAVAWQESLGEKGLLNSYKIEQAIGAFIDEKLVGIQTYAINETDSPGRLIGLLVDPDYRRLGIGRELTIKALDEIGNKEVYADVNEAASSLIDSLPEQYRNRVKQKDWFH